MMTVGELIELLEEMPEEAEVRLMTQENYPLEAHVACVNNDVDMANADADEGEDPEDRPSPEDEPSIVYICEGTQIGYGRKSAWSSR